MYTVTLESAKVNFRLGYYRSYCFHRAVLVKGWQVGLSDGSNEIFLSASKTKFTPRVFVSLDSAISAVEQVGFEINLITGVF